MNSPVVRPWLERAIPVLRTADYPVARAFYVDALGFVCLEEGGSPPQFGMFSRDDVRLIVNVGLGADRSSGQSGPSEEGASDRGWSAYIYAEGVDALYASLVEAGVDCGPPVDKVYGMRELEVCDPDGNVLCFGYETAPPVVAP